ncbi:MAG: prepilin-type N-terminal cleavage/methylation domain-containing protein [Actinobacteria bacterium]|nr:MAG: prepilin-type N-terminal cleavage/methylation domain-containing protein [Actinomycetota bacterium]
MPSKSVCLKNKKSNWQRGFTLVELMVVILIMAILMAIAVPVFLSSRDRAIARAAQSRLNQVVKAAKTLNAGGNADIISESVSGIDYGSMTAANIAGEISVFDMYDGAPGSPDTDDVWIDRSGADPIAFRTIDGNGTIHQASISSNGAVYYSQPAGG